MRYLIIFNFLVSISSISFIIYKYFPFYIEVNKTTWCKKPYSITLWMYTQKDKYSSSAKGLLTLPFRNEKKLNKWDDEMFNSGKYKTYYVFKREKNGNRN